jgi:formate/nitrite transporter FocA (FNT family)
MVIYLANLAGALGLVLLGYFSNHWQMNGNAVGIHVVKIATAKGAMPFWDAFLKGILCNILVCLAVWLALAEPQRRRQNLRHRLSDLSLRRRRL